MTERFLARYRRPVSAAVTSARARLPPARPFTSKRLPFISLYDTKKWFDLRDEVLGERYGFAHMMQNANAEPYFDTYSRHQVSIFLLKCFLDYL